MKKPTPLPESSPQQASPAAWPHRKGQGGPARRSPSSTAKVRGPSAFDRVALELHDDGLDPVPCGGEDGKKPEPQFQNWTQPRQRAIIARYASDGRFSGCNLGIVTGGERCAVTVVDCDDPDLVEPLLSILGETPLITATPSGGRHLWYAHQGEHNRNLRKLGLKVDIKGRGGLVIVPPSVRRRSAEHPGGAYTFVTGNWASLQRLPPIQPGGLDRLEDIGSPAEADDTQSADLSEVSEFAAVYEGERNDMLFRQALRDASTVNSEGELLGLLQHWNKQQCVPPLGRKEVKRIAASAWRYEQRGTNWLGADGVFQLSRQEFRALKSSAAMWLLATLRFAHGARLGAFAVSPKAMARSDAARGLGAAAIRDAVKELIEAGLVEEVHRGGRGKGDCSRYMLRRLLPSS